MKKQLILLECNKCHRRFSKYIDDIDLEYFIQEGNGKRESGLWICHINSCIGCLKFNKNEFLLLKEELGKLRVRKVEMGK